MSLLSFITDQQLKDAVDKLLICAQNALEQAELNFSKNVIDPFSAIFEMAGFQLNETIWIKNEKTRKAQKSLSNHVGIFHQKILGSVIGWEDLGVGKQIDLVSKEHKIIAEIKNKYNTVTGANLARLYEKLENLVMPKESNYKRYTAYYVAIVPKKPQRYDTFFSPSDNTIGSGKIDNPLIRKIDGYSFYEMVTGVEGALLQLFKALPTVIQDNALGKAFYFADIKFLDVFFDAAFLSKK